MSDLGIVTNKGQGLIGVYKSGWVEFYRQDSDCDGGPQNVLLAAFNLRVEGMMQDCIDALDLAPASSKSLHRWYTIRLKNDLKK